jgi:hypothetical protein
VPPEWTGETVQFPSTFFRGDYLLLVNARAGEPVNLTLQLNPLGRDWAKLFYVVHDPDGTRLAGDSIAERTAEIGFTPQQSGLHLVGLSAGNWGGAWRVVTVNAPVGVQWPERLSTIHGARRLYFHVPADMETLVLRIGGSGRETVRGILRDPAGEAMATEQTSPDNTVAELTADATVGTWSLELTEADTGVLEDAALYHTKGLPPVLSLHPEHVFRGTEE